MKAKSILLFLVMFILVPQVSHAQFGAIRKAINKQLEHKGDSSINKNAQEGSDKNVNEENEQGKNENSGTKDNSGTKRGLFGGKIETKYKDNYDFTGRIYMQMETRNKQEVAISDFYTYFNENNFDAGIDLQTVDPKDGKTVISTVFVFDHDSRAFLMLLSGNFGTISTIPSDSALAAQAKARGEDAKQPVVTRTGNSRIIAGYKCDEYKVVNTDKGGYSNVWMTKDFKVKADTKYWGKSGMPNYYNYPGFQGMVMLAMEEFDKDNNLVVKSETKEIDEKFKHSISTVGYTFTKTNFGMGGKSGKK
jgi:hypothetical protein